MKNINNSNLESSICPHRNTVQDSGFVVCQDCGLIMENKMVFGNSRPREALYSDSQRNYERNIRLSDSKAIQDPVIKEKYERIKTLEKWFRDYKTDFTEQKKSIELLKGYGIGLNIDYVKYKEIKDIYLKFNKYHRHSYQNMVIIFLAIVWMQIRDTTNVRIEEFINISTKLGHKINKKMLNNAMLKLNRTELMLKKNLPNLEIEIKNKIKIVFQKDLNIIPYEKVQEYFNDKSQFEKIKIDMLLLADKILTLIKYEQIQSLNYKSFTAGLIYYIGQTLDNKKIFTQSLVEGISKFSSTTIRKKYHILRHILGDPRIFDI